MSMTGSLVRQEGCQQRHLRVRLPSVLIVCVGSSVCHGDASVPTVMILFLPRAGGVCAAHKKKIMNPLLFNNCFLAAELAAEERRILVIEVRCWPVSILPNHSLASTSVPLPTKVRAHVVRVLT